MANPSVPAETRAAPFYPPLLNKCHINQKYFSFGIGGQPLAWSESLQQYGIRGDFCGQIVRGGNIL